MGRYRPRVGYGVLGILISNSRLLEVSLPSSSTLRLPLFFVCFECFVVGRLCRSGGFRRMPTHIEFGQESVEVKHQSH